MTFSTKNNKISGYSYDLDALKQSISDILETAVGEYEIFSWNYGNQILNMVGDSDENIQNKASVYIEEALLGDDRINDVYDFTFLKEGDEMMISFYIDTIYGVVESEVTI